MHHSVADFLLDIIQNSVEAKSRNIEVGLEEASGVLRIFVQDDGCGMDPQQIARALDPFYSDGTKHPGRRVGLGLPFLKQTIEGLEGEFGIDSRRGAGTRVWCTFPLDHIDTPPQGDMPGCLSAAMRFSGDYELLVHCRRPDNAWEARRSELLEALGDLDSVGSITLLREYLESLEDPHGKDDP